MSAIPAGTRLVVGSRVTEANLAELADMTDTLIVGSSTKIDGDPRNRVDADPAARLVRLAVQNGLP